MYEYSARLVNVHDGDSVTMCVDLGFSIQSMHAVRLAGIDAPELRAVEGRDARSWAIQWFRENPGPYVLQTAKGDETEKYGRYLGVISDQLTGRVFNDDILSAGYAAPYDGGKR